jgi:hypothetical protein
MKRLFFFIISAALIITPLSLLAEDTEVELTEPGANYVNPLSPEEMAELEFQMTIPDPVDTETQNHDISGPV